jgi:hypothetical protein
MSEGQVPLDRKGLPIAGTDIAPKIVSSSQRLVLHEGGGEHCVWRRAGFSYRPTAFKTKSVAETLRPAAGIEHKTFAGGPIAS